MACNTVFITGTDTAVGKTVVTALLLSHLRNRGGNVLAIKPFCTGRRTDPKILSILQGGELSIDCINPFYFREPVAPLSAARKHRRRIKLGDVLDHITDTQHSFHVPGPFTLLIEGAGGLLAPLGPGYSALEIMAKLRCDIIVVAANRLGTISHTLLTVRTLQASKLRRIKVVVSDLLPTPRSGIRDSRSLDLSTASNVALLRELLAPVPVHHLPYLGRNALETSAIKRTTRTLRPLLDRFLLRAEGHKIR